MSSFEEKEIENKDIQRIELTFESHCLIDLDEVFDMEDGDTNPFAEGNVSNQGLGRLLSNANRYYRRVKVANLM